MARICLILPVYNYADHLQASLAQLKAWQATHRDHHIEIIFSDDGSTDATVAILQKTLRSLAGSWQLVTHTQNTGKGGAVRRGFARARTLNPDIVVYSDCDLHYGLHIIFERMIPALQTSDIAIVDRSWQPARVQASSLRKLASGVFNRSVAILTGVAFRDTQAGLKAFRAETCGPIFDLLTIDGFTFDVEILSIALFYRLRVKQIPIASTKSSPTSRVLILRSSVRMIFDLIKININWKTGRYYHAALAKTIENEVYKIVD